MAKIPLPERGQPVDVTYLYQLANAVNDISSQVSSTTANYASINTSGADMSTLKTSDLSVVCSRVKIYDGTIVNVAQEKDFSFDFSNFKYAPIVTATPVNVGNTTAGKNVSVVLKNITTSRVEGVVRCGTAGELSLYVNLIIIGVPGS